MTATANARAGAPASGRLEHDVIRGFAEAYAFSDFDLSSLISPYDGVGPTGRLWGAEASASSSMSGVWAIGDPSVSSTIPIKLGFPFMLEAVAIGGVAPGGATGAVAAASGAFYVDNTLFYSFDVSQSTSTGRTVYVDGLLASDFAVDGFEYQPGKPLADYLTLAFDAPPGTWRFDLSVSVLSSNGLVPGDTGTAASASATIDPFLIVDPDWEFADLVTFELNSYVDYQGESPGGRPRRIALGRLRQPERRARTGHRRSDGLRSGPDGSECSEG